MSSEKKIKLVGRAAKRKKMEYKLSFCFTYSTVKFSLQNFRLQSTGKKIKGLKFIEYAEINYTNITRTHEI